MPEPRTLRLAKAAKKVADLAYAIEQGALSDVSRLPRAMAEYDRMARDWRGQDS